MESKTIIPIEKVDAEWVSLIKQAKEQGLSKEDIRIFFASRKVD